MRNHQTTSATTAAAPETTSITSRREWPLEPAYPEVRSGAGFSRRLCDSTRLSAMKQRIIDDGMPKRAIRNRPPCASTTLLAKNIHPTGTTVHNARLPPMTTHARRPRVMRTLPAAVLVVTESSVAPLARRSDLFASRPKRYFCLLRQPSDLEGLGALSEPLHPDDLVVADRPHAVLPELGVDATGSPACPCDNE